MALNAYSFSDANDLVVQGIVSETELLISCPNSMLVAR